MSRLGNISFELICTKHGTPGRCNKMTLGIEPKPKKRTCCPMCRKEYIRKHKLKNVSGIDWRYVNFNEEE